uniref:Uncharacterized protein LOC105034677 isoform X2 n=1 Tax=Elaeis guineensis var. tenera TaxID=51953 RepID=A0A6J0PEB9_ELAGV|nr:uncharacterized protein LOC105034677 isoform X2 [Elaeis guineensis]
MGDSDAAARVLPGKHQKLPIYIWDIMWRWKPFACRRPHTAFPKSHHCIHEKETKELSAVAVTGARRQARRVAIADERGGDASMRTAFASPSIPSSSYSPVVMVRSKKSQPQKGPDQAPPRITSNVKHNLQFLRLWRVSILTVTFLVYNPIGGASHSSDGLQLPLLVWISLVHCCFFTPSINGLFMGGEFQKQKSNTPKPATSYRKKKAVKEVLPEDTDFYKDPTTNLYYTNQGLDTAVPVLLVDGYNVCGYWAKLKKHFMKGRLDIARQKLIDELMEFSVLKEVKVVVVFDARMSGLPSHKESFAGIDVIFSSNTCADAWIEKEVVALREDGCPKVWVVTSDACQQQAAYGAGAFVWSCKALVSEIKALQREFEQLLNEHRSTSMQGKLLQHNLGPEVVHALKDLKKKLSEEESM